MTTLSTNPSGKKLNANLRVLWAQWFLILFLIFGSSQLQSQEAATDAETPLLRNYIHQLLVDKQMPLLGIRWQSEVFVDAPINGEPEGADVSLRRAQVSLNRGFGSNWSGKVTFNYNSDGKFEAGDTFLHYAGWKTSIVQMGIFNPAFSLESLTKSGGLSFMERSLPVVALSENKSGGISILKRTSNNILNAGFFFLNPSQDDRVQPGKAIVLHYAHSPIDFLGTDNLYLGASMSYRFAVDPNKTLFKTRPEVATADDHYVDTGAIADADKVIRLGLEAHKEWGRLSLQTELLFSRVERTQLPAVRFWGAYTTLSWFLTQDNRNFDAGSGRFLALRPANPLGRGGKGAFELTLRASYVDLSDQNVVGGQQSDITVGLNWYLNNSFRVMSNLVKVVDVNRPGSEFDGLDPLILSMRLQWQML